MKKPLLIVLAAALVLIPAAGFAATLVDNGDLPPVVPEDFQEYLDSAAEEMGMTQEQATAILEQARELRIRMNANRLGISYEEMLERRTERFQNRGQGRGGRGFRGWGPCR